jgi:hypothetical protein
MHFSAQIKNQHERDHEIRTEDRPESNSASTTERKKTFLWAKTQYPSVHSADVSQKNSNLCIYQKFLHFRVMEILVLSSNTPPTHTGQ